MLSPRPLTFDGNPEKALETGPLVCTDDRFTSCPGRTVVAYDVARGSSLGEPEGCRTVRRRSRLRLSDKHGKCSSVERRELKRSHAPAPHHGRRADRQSWATPECPVECR